MDNTLLRVTSYLGLLVAHATQEGKNRVHPEYLAKLDHEPGMIEWLFELASETELGEAAELSDVVPLLQALPGETPLLIVNLELATVLEKSALQTLADEEANMVGVAILARSSPEWIYWRPVSHPIGDSRLLILPLWRRSRIYA
jgi:hypothetical protein